MQDSPHTPLDPYTLLASHEREERLLGIHLLGETGDLAALEALRVHMQLVNRELLELILAVGKLKVKLGVK